MSIPELISPESDVCGLVERWGIDDELARRLIAATWRLEFPVSIISGFRTTAMQDYLRRAGSPTAPNDRSTHLSCPATGADLLPQIAITNVVKARLGTEMHLAGLRWGGNSDKDPDTGIPSDWNHFDLGPRR